MLQKISLIEFISNRDLKVFPPAVYREPTNRPLETDREQTGLEPTDRPTLGLVGNQLVSLFAVVSYRGPMYRALKLNELYHR